MANEASLGVLNLFGSGFSDFGNDVYEGGIALGVLVGRSS